LGLSKVSGWDVPGQDRQVPHGRGVHSHSWGIFDLSRSKLTASHCRSPCTTSPSSAYGCAMPGHLKRKHGLPGDSQQGRAGVRGAESGRELQGHAPGFVIG